MDMEETCELRVTSISGPYKDHLFIRGMPLIEGTSIKASARRIIVVRAGLDQLALQPAPGQHWRLIGLAEERHSDHGDYRVQELYFDTPPQLECIMPDNGEGFISFLAKEPDFIGIGQVKARKLWEEFGKRIFTLLEVEDTDEISAIVGAKATAALLTGYEKYANLKYTSLLKELGVPLPIQMRLMRLHGPASVARIQKNPYTLIIFGMSFAEVDKLAHRLYSIAADDPRRIGAAVGEALVTWTKKGHTSAEPNDLMPLLRKLLVSDELVAAALAERHCKSYVVRNGRYMATQAYIMSQVVAKRLITLVDSKPPSAPADAEAVIYGGEDLPYTLTQRQEEAVVSSVQNRISCICGGAGTGKTTVLRTVLRAYDHLEYDIFAVALSGRAAMRLHESTGFKTSTIASFLDKRTPEPDPQKNTLLVVDEVSMVDIITMYQLVSQMVADKHRILLVGDDAQLPPIGPGAVLRDILDSGIIPAVHLDVVQRSCASTGIPEYSGYIRSLQAPPLLSAGNIKFHQATVEQQAAVCADLYARAPQNSRIVAYTRRTVAAINHLCQHRFNSKGKVLKYEHHGDTFLTELRQGDPVLITRNDTNLGVQNGTLAVLTSATGKGDILGELTLDTGKKIDITLNLLDDLALGYAVTLHKAQGSQFPTIIAAIEDVGNLLDNAWIYTAVTRAEISLHLVGDEKAFAAAVSRVGSQHRRQTCLKYLLKS